MMGIFSYLLYLHNIVGILQEVTNRKNDISSSLYNNNIGTSTSQKMKIINVEVSRHLIQLYVQQ